VAFSRELQQGSRWRVLMRNRLIQMLIEFFNELLLSFHSKLDDEDKV
jgi:hypothetical protein